MSLVLHISAGKSAREKCALADAELPAAVGRASASVVSLPFKGVSRQHCVIERAATGAGYCVRDLGSTVGTFVNGERVDTAPLHDGDVLRLGIAVLRVEIVTGGAQPPDPEAFRSTDSFPVVEVKASCEMCGLAVDGQAVLAGASLLADDRALCAACVGHVETVPRIGPFRFLRPLGTGGCGSVHKALHEAWRRIVAVKTVSFAGTPPQDAVARLQREVEIGRALRHPNIVALHEAFTDGHSFYLVMEYVDGGTLERLVGAKGALPFADAARLARELGSALDLAHASRFIHRDVKPANVLLDRSARSVLTDFGLARTIHDTGLGALTATGQGMGTPRFMAPEQFEDAKRAGPPADVYGFAATLYFALTGRAPYEELRNLRDLYLSVGKKPAVPASSIREGLPEAASSLLAAGMHANPARRPQRAGDLAERLASALSDG